MSNSRYWAIKLEKIQFAISQIHNAQRVGLEAILERLQEQEAQAANDLIEAEQNEQQK